MRWSKAMYALMVMMMVTVAAGTASFLDVGPTKAGLALHIQTAHAEEAATTAPAEDKPVVPIVTEVPVSETSPPKEEVVDDDSFFQAAIKAVAAIMNEIKKEGVSKVSIALAVLLIVSQLLIQLTKTALFGKLFKTVSGAGKLAIVSICTVVTTLVPMVLSGVPLMQALTSGAVFSAIMVAGHQVYKQFIEKKS